MRIKNLLFLMILVLLGSFAWGASKLVILSPHNEAHRREITNAFTQYYKQKYKTDIQIEWMDQGGGSDIMRYIKSEYKNKPRGIGVDLMFGGGIDPYLELGSMGLLQPCKIDPSVLKQIPRDIHGIPIYDNQYRWYGTALAGFGILKNNIVSQRLGLPAVRTWQDLTNPKLQGWISSADPRHSGSVHMMYEIILQAYGWEKGWEIITQMGGNIKSFTQSASNTPTEVGMGNAAYGLCIDTYAWSQIAKVGRSKMSFILPSGVTVINPDGIGVLKGAPNISAAKAFVEFSLSPSAQKLLMLPAGSPQGPKQFDLYRMAVIPGLYTTLGQQSQIPVNPFQLKSVLKYDTVKGARRYSLLNDMIGALVIDSHKELGEAWSSVKGTPKARGIGRPPLTEAQAMALAEKMKNDPQLRNKMISQWTVFARNKYRTYKK